MNSNKFYFLALVIIFSITISCQKQVVSGILVRNIDEFNSAVANAKAGDEIVLANGVWKDVELVLKGEGTKESPIKLKAETEGEVFIEGVSNLKIGGKFLEVSGLYFRNGHTPSGTVIEFLIDKETFANNCKVTNCVIEDFTQPNREDTDHWVEFWGRNNELSNCYLAGKSNFGPTIRVFLKGNEHIKNNHKIINNHFGPRPRKGGPHGETLQIGDSGTSMTPSNTIVANNFFDRCNGEVEIISSKSNNNEFRNNIFFECEGSLVVRHGNYATIDGNIFIGNDNSKFIGGIRVVNTGHWITNNYFYKINGSEFRSALAVMNGIPKSPLNRYNQVTDVVVAYNSFIDCKSPLNFSVGSNVDKSDVLPASEIRSERPERTILANNLIYNQTNGEYPIVNYDKVDGVLFKNNILNSENKSEVKSDGLITKKFEVNKLSDWLYAPTQNDSEIYAGFDFETITKDLFGNDRTTNNSIGAICLPVNESKINIDKKAYGPTWFNAEKQPDAKTIVEVSTVKDLIEGLKNAKSGDILTLKAGVYDVNQALVIDKKITIKSADANSKATLNFGTNTQGAAFQMHPKGNLILESVLVNGTPTQDAVATLDKNMSIAFNLVLNNTEINNFKSVLKVSKGSFADTISVVNSTIKNCISGIQLAEEIDDKGDYNAEFVYIKNSKFEAVQKDVLNYHRGGYDESTIGGNLEVTASEFINCGKADKTGILLKNRGIVNVTIADNKFTNNPVKLIAILWGEKGQKPGENIITNSGKFEIQQNLKMKLMY
ncbi:chondroitinase-B domain-containing protein [Lutibacter sp.]|uniref:chondroitinase-B domain-containing protein n=1 Tax=Lutibacter sp. TaxID=1925666 RepID=UPI0035635D82